MIAHFTCQEETTLPAPIAENTGRTRDAGGCSQQKLEASQGGRSVSQESKVGRSAGASPPPPSGGPHDTVGADREAVALLGASNPREICVKVMRRRFPLLARSLACLLA